MADTVQIQGLEPLLKVLAGLPSKVAMNVMRPAMEEAGNIVASATRINAMKVLRDAESKGYKRESGKHLYEAIGSRTKMYQKGGSVFVGSGFQFKAGGFHGHLVEKGHRIVKGGTLLREGRQADISAAGKRWLESHGFVSKSTISVTLGGQKKKVVLGKGKDKLTITLGGRKKSLKIGKRGGWTDIATGKFIKTKDITNARFNQMLRGGGRVIADKSGADRMTQPRPMLSTAWAETKGVIANMLELQISMGLQAQAETLAAASGVKA